uniref:Ribosomal L1 domain-containing protein n=1 Tax=Anopheles coluzzii TaxID=1518534 RepID=A0A6E8VSC8_ANOCL|nr:ribosomal L1 domain-containing protein CG13096-like [Anopheles coluzzii]
MKVKPMKKEKPAAKGSGVLKKSKTDIQKAKKVKSAGPVKESAAKVVAAAKLLEKKKEVKLVKASKTKADKEDAEQENEPPQKLVQANGKAPAKQEKGSKSMKETANEEKMPPLNGKGPKPTKQVTDEEDSTKPENESKAARRERQLKLKALKKKQKKLGGKVVSKVSEETLALVPEQLVTKASFRKLYEVVHNKFNEKGNKLFGDDLKYALQVVAVKVPRCPLRICRVALPHTLMRKEDEMCLIVKDNTRGRDVDYLPTLHHWEDKLKELSVGYNVQVIPFQQLKRDYSSFEMKRKLVHRFERFVVDARISGHVFSFLGTQFARRGKNPIAVKLDSDVKIKESIEQAALVQTFRQTYSGPVTEIKFAVHWMPVEQAVANGMALLEQLKTIYPGGWLNVQAINLKTVCEKSYSLPIYVSTIDPNLVPVPIITGPRQVFVQKQQKLFSKQTGGKYEVTKDGVVRRVKKPSADGEENNEPDSDVEMTLEDFQPDDDDNWVPYDDEPPARPRTGGRPRQRGPKMRIK